MPSPSLLEPTPPRSPEIRSAAPLPKAFYVVAGLLVAAFGLTFAGLFQLSLANSLYSHLPLIPVVSLYLVWIQRSSLPAPGRPWVPLAGGLALAGLGVVAAYFMLGRSNPALQLDDALAWQTYAFLLLFGSACAWFLGRDLFKAVVFPLGFLVFLAPFPVAVHDAMEAFLQHWSADAAYLMIDGAGTPILRDELIFHLPGIVLEVAPQCSGIRSSVALFITSVVAGYFFLRSPWKRLVLTLFVIPLAILRNGLRIFTIAQLCVYVSPDMVNSFIHHRGGPIFFAISLVPFFGLLYLFYRSDRRQRPPETSS